MHVLRLVPDPAPENLEDLAYRRRLAFGAVVRRHRDGLGLSAANLADKTGLTRVEILAIEHAASSATVDQGHLLADALGTDLAEQLHESRYLARCVL